MGRALPVTLTLMLAACAWRGPLPIQTYSGVDQNDAIQTMDKAAWKLVALSAQQAERLPDGRMQVTLELANLSSLDLAIQVQTVFRNDQGMLTGDETNWEMVVLPGSGSTRYQVTSLQAGAESYSVQIRTP